MSKEKDAARYAYIRENGLPIGASDLIGSGLDEAIDKEILAEANKRARNAYFSLLGGMSTLLEALLEERHEHHGDEALYVIDVLSTAIRTGKVLSPPELADLRTRITKIIG